MDRYRFSGQPGLAALARLVADLARNRAGNTLVLVAAALLPLVALLGSGVDLGRAYLVQSRLQQACDAGALGARKELSTFSAYDPATDQAQVFDAGQRFFDVNFPAGIYGTQGRTFDLAVGADYAVSGAASVDVPTTLMGVFGFKTIPVRLGCAARISATNTDIMMALDVTSSMSETLPGDTQAKITALRQVVKDFWSQVEASKAPGARIRYGFVPYSTNVNVGALLSDDWVAPASNYDARVLIGSIKAKGTFSYYGASSVASGYYDFSTDSTYQASSGGEGGGYSCPTKPSDTLQANITLVSTTQEAVSEPQGTRTTQTYEQTRNGDTYAVALSGQTCTVTKTSFHNYVTTWDYITEPGISTSSQWDYKSMQVDNTGWRTASDGCMEEPETYEIDDYNNVDLTRARDLDIDAVPDPSDPATQWKPEYPNMIYERAKGWDGTGAFQSAEVQTNAEFIAPGRSGLAPCPTEAKKLQAWTKTDLDSYIDGLEPKGSTYHDIGLLWAARLISPKGIFASENADVGGTPTNRNLIFFTDGETSTLDVSYGAYGIEPIDQRRWGPSSPLSLNQTVEKRFGYVCDEVKNHNVAVWFVAFGANVNPIMADCAGPGHVFKASNATELNDAFSQIARSIGDLRLSR